MKRRQILKSIFFTKGLFLTGLSFPGTAWAGSGPSGPSGPSRPSAPSARNSGPSRPSAPSARSSDNGSSSRNSSNNFASGPSGPETPSGPRRSSSRGSFPSSPSAVSLPSTVSRPSGPDDYLEDNLAHSPEERRALLTRIEMQLKSDGLQPVSSANLDALLAEYL